MLLTAHLNVELVDHLPLTAAAVYRQHAEPLVVVVVQKCFQPVLGQRREGIVHHGQRGTVLHDGRLQQLRRVDVVGGRKQVHVAACSRSNSFYHTALILFYKK